MPIEKDYYNLVEKPNYLKHILYGDTDSIFIQIPDNSDNVYDKIRKMNKVLTDVNNLIVDYTKNELMVRCGYNPDRCETNFKGEMLIDSILFIDVKKSYAYKQIAAEADVNENNELVGGKIFKEPIIVKRSTLGLKGDTIALTKDIMSDIINISFDDTLSKSEKLKTVYKNLGDFNRKFKEAISNLNISYIGSPVRWQKKDYVIYGMKLYNAIVEPVFQYLSPGYSIECKFNSLSKIKSLGIDIPIEKMNMFVFPNELDVEKTNAMLKKYEIEIDVETQWSKVFNTVCERLLNNLK